MLEGTNVTQKIKALMAAYGYNQDVLARVIGRTVPTIVGRYHKQNWKADELYQIAKFFKIDIKELM